MSRSRVAVIIIILDEIYKTRLKLVHCSSQIYFLYQCLTLDLKPAFISYKISSNFCWQRSLRLLANGWTPNLTNRVTYYILQCLSMPHHRHELQQIWNARYPLNRPGEETCFQNVRQFSSIFFIKKFFFHSICSPVV